LTLLLAACGSDVDISGVYNTTYETSNPQGCTEGPMMIRKPFFQAKKQEILGQSLFTVSFCDTMDTGTCSTSLGGAVLPQRPDDGYTGRVGIAGGGPTSTLGYIRAAAPLPGGKLRVEVKIYGGDVPLTADQCTTQEAESRGTSLPCKTF